MARHEVGRYKGQASMLGSCQLDRLSGRFRASKLTGRRLPVGREREFADLNSGHTGADQPGALPAQLLSVSSPPQTGR